MIFDYLIPKLEKVFPNRGLKVDKSEGHAVFPAIHPSFGDLEIHDDGEEITIYAGNFTHGHFSNYEDGLSPEEAAKKISERVIAFLEATFADKMVFWGSNTGAGGWGELSDSLKRIFENHGVTADFKKKYVWSGPLE